MRPNPPIKGHHLMFEGGTHLLTRNGATDWSGGCECGAKPADFPNTSRYAMRKWHREHKAEIRAGIFDS